MTIVKLVWVAVVMCFLVSCEDDSRTEGSGLLIDKIITLNDSGVYCHLSEENGNVSGALNLDKNIDVRQGDLLIVAFTEINTSGGVSVTLLGTQCKLFSYNESNEFAINFDLSEFTESNQQSIIFHYSREVEEGVYKTIASGTATDFPITSDSVRDLSVDIVVREN